MDARNKLISETLPVLPKSYAHLVADYIAPGKTVPPGVAMMAAAEQPWVLNQSM